jgi:hypothetical protein
MLLGLHMELPMKKVDGRELPTVIFDNKDVSDSGKVKIGNLSPVFPPLRAKPANVGDAGKVRLGNFSPAFPPVRPSK